MKKIIISVLLLTLCLSFTWIPVGADDSAEAAAEALNTFGICLGVGDTEDGRPNYDLDRALTREESVTLLVRCIGGEASAQAVPRSMPFTDVSEWARPYVSFAWEQGLTKGTSATTFEGPAPVSAAQFLTFVLRLMGYQSGRDFSWNTAWELSDSLEITDGQFSADTLSFTRGNAFEVLYRALALMSGKTYFGVVFNPPAVLRETDANAFPTAASVSYDEASMVIRLPAGWSYAVQTREQKALEDGFDLFGIEFWPEAHPELRLELEYLYERPEVCGTGVTATEFSCDSGLSLTRYTESDGNTFWLTAVYTRTAAGPMDGRIVLRGGFPAALWEQYEAEIMDIAGTAELLAR